MKDVFVQKMFGFRPSQYIEQGKCVPAPMGCGGDAKSFNNELDEKEYKISGLCSDCQKKYFE